MLPEFVDKKEAEIMWRQISHEALDEAYDKYMKKIEQSRGKKDFRETIYLFGCALS